MRSPCVCVNFDSKAVYQSLHQLTIIPPILGSATLVTRNKSRELPTNCRLTELELLRISCLNVCHCRGDLEPQHAETKRSPRTPNQSTTLGCRRERPFGDRDLVTRIGFRSASAGIRDSSPDPTLLHVELMTSCQWCLNSKGLSKRRTLYGDKLGCSPVAGLA
jgi:hypothetical protein